MIYARIGVGLNEAYSATLLIYPEDEAHDELPPPEEAIAIAQAPETTQAAETAPYLQPDLSTLVQSAGVAEPAVNQEAKTVLA